MPVDLFTVILLHIQLLSRERLLKLALSRVYSDHMAQNGSVVVPIHYKVAKATYVLYQERGVR